MGRQTRAQAKAVGKGRDKAPPQQPELDDESEEVAHSPAPSPAARARAAPRARQTTRTKAAAAKGKAGAAAAGAGATGGASLTADQAKRVALFMRTTGGSDSDALECLVEVEGWDVEAAVDCYYTGGRADKAGKRGGARAVEALFRKYREPGEGGEQRIGVDGVVALCSDLGVEPEDPVLLVISHYMGAALMCEFSRAEFTHGLARMGVDSLAGLRAALPGLRAQLGGAAKFREVYGFAYDFSREKNQKCVQLDSALAMWRLLFSAVPGQQWPLVGEWCSFLARAHKGKAVPKDTWLQLLDFVKSVKADLSNFDEHSSWPYLIDEFVEHLRAQRKAEAEGQQ